MEEPTSGVIFEALDEAEAEFLYEEIFTRRSYLQHGLRIDPGDWIIDAGANIGLFAMFAVQEAAGVSVLAFEPVKPIYDVLCRNCTSACDASGGTITPFCIGLGKDAGRADFSYYRDAPGESTRYPAERESQRRELLSARARRMQHLEKEGANDSAHDQERRAELEMLKAAVHDTKEQEANAADIFSSSVTTLATVLNGEASSDDHYILPSPSEPIALLKVDVEGDELAVLEGMSADCWTRVKQVVVEVIDAPGTDRLRRVVCLLEAKGYVVASTRQQPAWEAGYFMYVPRELHMYYVYARREGSRMGEAVAAMTMSEGGAAEAEAEVVVATVALSTTADMTAANRLCVPHKAPKAAGSGAIETEVAVAAGGRAGDTKRRRTSHEEKKDAPRLPDRPRNLSGIVSMTHQ
jgi:FkbM family methyltransferase